MLLIITAIASSIIITLGSCAFYLMYQIRQDKKDYQALEVTLQASEQNIKKLKLELTAIQNKLVNETLRDPLTNLPSYSTFEQELQRSLEKSKRFELISAVLFLEINDLQTIRDALGQEEGNALLKQIAEVVLSGIRKVDTAARFSPNTFVIFLSQLNKLESINIVIQRLFKVFSQSFQVQEKELYFAISVGIAAFPNDGQESASLLQNAEKALLLAKRRGTNTYQFYQADMQQQSQRELLLYTSLGQENLLNDFELNFKPIFNIQDNTIVCMDANIQSPHPELRMVSLDDLFQVAESCGRMTTLTESLIQAVCTQLQEWKKFGLAYCMGIPMLLKHVETPQFIYNLAELIKTQGIEPSSIVLNITCKNFVYSEQLEKTFHMLKHIGVKLAITDIGAYCFSLEIFKHLPMDFLKLHSSFIDDLTTNEKTQNIVKSMALLTGSLHTQLIIQGVKSQEQIQQLQEFGCGLVQGPFLTASLKTNAMMAKMMIDEG